MPIKNNLYPPIMPDVIPAFIRTEPCKIYFSLSSYNSTADIKNVQISLVNQKTNISALNPILYPSGIKIDNINYDSSIKGQYNCYIQIDPTDLANEIFELNQYYKIQIRFTSVLAENPPSNGTELDTWLYNNTIYFSQWSTACILKGIEQPQFSFENFSEEMNEIPTQIVGKMFFEDIEEDEYLKSYNIKIYELLNNTIVMDSGILYTNYFNPNEYYYVLPYDLFDNVNYKMVFTYTTNNFYSNTIEINFKINEQVDRTLDVNIKVTPEEQDGRIKIDVDLNYTTTTKNLIIKRTSSRSNFKKWEDLKTIIYNEQQLKYLWYDTCIQSGIWYKYRIQQAGTSGRKYTMPDPVICYFEDMFLTAGNKQLKIKFNPTISEFKYNVNESQQNTLGSKYPYVKRNGNNFFRTFSIGGLITSFIDSKDWYDPGTYDNGVFISQEIFQPFSSKNEIYGETESLYNQYNIKNNVGNYQDFVYERQFRQKVMDFLYQNNIKLFRSLTEGNILVKLMNITLQPVNQLGRRLYSFSASAVQIDDTTITNYIKYNLINYFHYSYKKGQIEGEFDPLDSIFNKINLSKELIKIFELLINVVNDNIVVYIKPTEDDDQALRYVLTDHTLSYKNENNSAIKDVYFGGVHIEKDAFTEIDGYYDNFDEIQTPIENGVYNISYYYDNIVTDYVQQDDHNNVLTITEQGAIKNLKQNYALLVHKECDRFIFKNGEWYLFTPDDDILIPINAHIIYYYLIKEIQ